MTADPELLPDVQEFLRRHVTSHDQLKVLLAISEDDTKWWTFAQVARIVDSSPKDLPDMMRPLAEAGLLAARGSKAEMVFRFASQHPSYVQVLSSLRELNEQSSLVLLRAVTTHAIERIRAGARKTFSDALPDDKGPKER